MGRSFVPFAALLAFSLTPWTSPPAALLLGIACALVFGQPAPGRVRVATKALLPASVVGLGFGMNLHRVLRAGAQGLDYTSGGIAFALTLGWLLGRLLKVGDAISRLVSVGTAICGGSAIATVGPVIGADDEEMSIALGTVFLLNSAALILFPPIGRACGLSQSQFGLWAALAIHDTSLVVGACLNFGADALAVGATHLPQGAPVWTRLHSLAKAGLTATLFLIGTGISRAALQKVGARPLVQGIALWAMVATTTLALIRAGVIR